MATKKLLASFGSIKKDKDGELDAADVEKANKGDESGEDDWVKIEDIIETESNIKDDIKDIVSNDKTINPKEDTLQSEKQIDVEKENDVFPISEQNESYADVTTVFKDQNNVSTPIEFAFINETIPPCCPKEKIIVVSNLPKRLDRNDLIPIFSKYGSITHIQKMMTAFLIAFSDKNEASNALGANNTRIEGRQIRVRLRFLGKKTRGYPKDQIIFLFDLLPNIPDKIIKKHFSECGKINMIKNYRCQNGINRLLVFSEGCATEAALRYDGTSIENAKIRVKPKAPSSEYYTEGTTIVMFNVNQRAELAQTVVLEIFSKCGKIAECNVLCYRRKLAIITFEDEEGADNAMKLNDTTVGDIQIQLAPYTTAKYKQTKIIASNLVQGITETDVIDFFNPHAFVDNVHLVKNRLFALIEFANTDDYCNAFRLHGENLLGQEISLKPFVDKDESLEYILYADNDWMAVWGDRPMPFRYRRRRHKK